MDPSNGNLDVLIGERGFFICTSGGQDGYGVGVRVTSLSNELEPWEDGILMGSFGVMDFCATHAFLYFRKEDGMIG